MNGYLIFALVAALELASPGTTHFGIDVVRGGILDSQFSVSVNGSVSRFLRTVVAPASQSAASGTVEQNGPYMQVERSAAFGHIYTVIPGPAMDYREAASTGSRMAGGDAAASGSPAPAVRAPASLPPLAFSLASLLNTLQSPGLTRDQRITIDDPVQLLAEALGSTSTRNGPGQTETTVPNALTDARTAGTMSSSAGAAAAPTGSANAPGTSGGNVAGPPGENRTLTLSVYQRNNLLYLEMADHGLLLVIRPSS